MKKPAKFNNYVAALMFGVGTYSEDLASNIFSMVFGLNDDEVDECSQYLDYIIGTDNLVEQKTCQYKGGGRYARPGELVPQDIVYTCSACKGLGDDPEGNQFFKDDPKEPIQFTEVPGFMRYCPLCGAKVIKDEQTSEV